MSNITPESLSLGGGPFKVDATGLDNLLSQNVPSQPKARFVSSLGASDVDGSMLPDSNVSRFVLQFDAPPLEKPQTVDVSVSFNGFNFIPCGHIEYSRPVATALEPRCAPVGGGTRLKILGKGLYGSDKLRYEAAPTPSFVLSGDIFLNSVKFLRRAKQPENDTGKEAGSVERKEAIEHVVPATFDASTGCVVVAQTPSFELEDGSTGTYEDVVHVSISISGTFEEEDLKLELYGCNIVFLGTNYNITSYRLL